ncbi:Glyoxalase/Bleomycin resistance protein/Dihydroxybiphenyl dioxygenase [Xylaria palmicola]|nr:Glyoxalase/Bleomycin resistance protein/Dihydroxybiphenyl dioxygenase [Xylaria palmicola]
MANDSNATKVLPPKYMAHVVFKTPALKPMSDFYKTFFGAHASIETDRMAFLTYDEEHHRIALFEVPGLAPRARESAGVDHVAFTYGTLGELLTAYRQRKAAGILPVQAVNHGPTTSLYYQDPDGNRIETQVDNFDTVEETNAYMRGPELRRNAFGADVDPDELLRKLESGVPEAELKRREDVGVRGVDDIPWN